MTDGGRRAGRVATGVVGAVVVGVTAALALATPPRAATTGDDVVAAPADDAASTVALPLLVHGPRPDPARALSTPTARAVDGSPTAAPTATPAVPATPDAPASPPPSPPTPASPPPAPDFAPFGLVRLAPQRRLDGDGTTIDSLAFWDAPDPADALLLVTAKGNQRVEVWPAPFDGPARPSLRHAAFAAGSQVNGIAIDAVRSRAYVAVSRPASTVVVFVLPGLAPLGQLVEGRLDLRGEPNLALLARPDGARRLYVSADDHVYRLDPESGAVEGKFRPGHALEAMLADDRDQVLYIPDETRHTGVHAYDADGRPYARAGRTGFGDDGVFEADAEGIAGYACRGADGADDGRGWIVVADQRAAATDFEVFDRRSWDHLGRLQLDGVAATDGVASTQQPQPGYPAGVLAAVHSDTDVALVGWDRVIDAAGLRCDGAPAAARR